MNEKSDQPSPPASSSDPSPWSLAGALAAKLNAQVFIFAVLIVIVVALLGDRVPPAFQALIYAVVLLCLAAYVVLEVMQVWAERDKAKLSAAARKQTTKDKSEPVAPVESKELPRAANPEHPATADHGSAAATGGSQAAADHSVECDHSSHRTCS